MEVLVGADRSRPGAPEGAYNVVLLLGCTVRRDQVGVHGGPPGITPWIDGLAARGARFTDLVAAAPWTRPATAALLTGRHALELGMVEPGDGLNRLRLPERATTLAERFADAGWTTLGATANPNLHADLGFAQGFDRYLQPAALWSQTDVKLMGPDVLPGLTALLDERPDPERPVFLQVMLVDAHAPHLADEATVQRWSADGVPTRVARYRAGLHGLDGSLAALEAALAGRLDPARTIVAFVSDHGEGLSWPAHHGRSHGRYLYGSAVDAVFVVAGPGIPAGTEVPGVASHLDVGPTLLALAGIAAERAPQAPVRRARWVQRGAIDGIHHEEPDDPDGARDLSASARTGAPTGRERAHSDTWYATAKRSAVRTSARACLLDFAVDEPPAPTGQMVPGCYDRAADPLEERPLLEDDAALTDGLRAWRDGLLARAWPGEPMVDASDVDAGLRALGYVEVPE